MRIKNSIFLPSQGRTSITLQRLWREGLIGSRVVKLFMIAFLVFTDCLHSQSSLDKTIEQFNKRHEKAKGLLADSNLINKCITDLGNEIEKGNNSEKCALY